MAQAKPPSRDEVERNLRQNRGPDERHGEGRIERIDMHVQVEEKCIDDRGFPTPTHIEHERPGAKE